MPGTGPSFADAAPAAAPRSRRLLLGVLFLASGAAALCYEIAWTRHLVLVFGNTTRAVALLLGAYMLGLALGSEFGGRLADRTRRPALLYAAFEFAIALFALAFPWLVDGIRAVYLALGTPASPVLFVLAFLALVIPTFCMGTTLPLLARATVDDASKTGRDVGYLYAANIVGAVLGAGATGFVLMESAGVLGATRWAAAVNAAVGIVGWIAFRGTAGTRPDAAPAGDADEVADAARPSGAPSVADASSHLRRAALVSAFASGCVGLAAQVAWTRLLTYFLNGFTWTFTAILSVFLAGLALGGAVFGRAASASRDPAKLLVRLHLLVAVAIGVALWTFGSQVEVVRSAWSAAGALVGDPNDMATRHRLMLVLASGAVLFVPAFLMGGCFPVATALYQRGLADLGARVGRLYAVNTAGCVLGSLVAGFVLQPAFGPSRAASVVMIAACAFAFAVAWAGRVRVPVLGAAAVIACVALDIAAEPGMPTLLRSHVFAGDRAREVVLRDTRHGQVCTVSVVENTRERFRLLYTDEFEAAGTKPEYRYMRMLAHLPVALARDPSRTLVICFGTGTTSGSVATHRAVRTLDLVEISPEVLATADAFRDVNQDVLRGAGRSDLDVRVHVDDGRHFVLRSRERWGVISLEPLMPYTPAAIHFYTRDFYEICRDRLEPGGLMCQWIPLQGMSGDDFRRLVAAFVAVFPESAMFFVDGAVALVGGPDGVEMSWARVSERLADPRVAADLRDVGFADPARALATFVTGGRRLRDFVDGVEPVTDERPVLEFHPIPPGVALPWLGQNLEHMRALQGAFERVPVDFTGVAEGDAPTQELFLALRSTGRVLEGMVRVATSEWLVRLGRRSDAVGELEAAREEFLKAVALDPGNETARRQHDSLEREWWTIQGGAATDARDFAGAERHLRRALEYRGLRQADVAWTRLAEALNAAGNHEAALEAACEATRLFPFGLDANAERAMARSALGDLAGAYLDYRVAVEGSTVAQDPDWDLLPERFRKDAERVRSSDPSLHDGSHDGSHDGKPDGRRRRTGLTVEAILAGATLGKIPQRLVLRIAAADDPDGFAEQFRTDLGPPTPDVDDATAAARIARLQLAAPAGAGEALAAWVVAGRAPVLRAAAEALVDVDRERAVGLLVREPDGPRALALVRAAARTTDVRFVQPLLDRLTSGDAALRVSARDTLFAILGSGAPGLDTLDPADANAPKYVEAVRGLRAWWARRPVR